MTKKNIIIGVVALITMLLIISNITFAKDEATKLTAQHVLLDQQIRVKFDSWVAENGNKDFCMPKAKLLSDEIEIRESLGDDTTNLKNRRDRVMDECNEVVRSVLFTPTVKSKN